jgi:hypothetical protein
MEKISNKKLDINGLQNALEQEDYDKFRGLIKKMAEDVRLGEFISTDTKSEFNLDPFVGFSKEDIEKNQKAYLQQTLDYIQKLAQHEKWDRLKIAVRHMEYYNIPNCTQKDFLNQCSKLQSRMSPIKDASIREVLSHLEKRAMIRLEDLSKKEISKDLWSTIVEVKNFNNPILKKTQDLFFQVLHLIAYKTENIARCLTEIKSQNKNSFIESDGKITIARASLENMMDECKYGDVLTNDLREYLNTLFCVSHICDDKKQEVDFFDLYGDQIMAYLIKVTLKLASLPSQKIADLVN